MLGLGRSTQAEGRERTGLTHTAPSPTAVGSAAPQPPGLWDEVQSQASDLPTP